MRIAETLNEGLKREYSVHVPAADLAARVDAQLGKVAAQVRMPGFRPGKVPLNLVRKMHGPQLLSDALQEAVNEGMQQLIADHKLRPAMQPRIDLAAPPAAGEDVDFTVAVEVLPVVEAPNLDNIVLEKLVVDVDDAAVNTAVARLADQARSFTPAAEGHAAAAGDSLLIDFSGTVDGEAFDGGTGEGMRVLIGSGQLIPGFEDQLVGAVVGDHRTVKVSFPADYNVAYLAGRAAEFSVTVKGIDVPEASALDDEFAKKFGIDGIDALREILKDQVAAELATMTRTHMKRKLLDTLASAHDFAVPQSMVDAEFDAIWRQVEAEEETPSDSDRAEYRRIAERRVRLGLLLSEIGQANGVAITQAEMNRLIGQEAAKYDAKEQGQVVKYFQENAMAAAQLRAPLYEDKVVDFLLGKATVTERTVTREALQAEIESDDETPGVGARAHDGHVHGPDCDHDHDHAGHDHAGHDHAEAAKPAKKSRAKKLPVVDPAADDVAAASEPQAAVDPDAAAPADAAPAKKPRAKKAAAE